MEFLFLMCPVNSNLKLRQVVMKFAFLFQCLISSIWLKMLFLKPFFVLKKKTLIFHRIFLPKVLLAAVFKNSGICEYCSMFKAKKSLMGPFYRQNLKNRNNWISIPKMLLKIYGYDFTQREKSPWKILHPSRK